MDDLRNDAFKDMIKSIMKQYKAANALTHRRSA